jgi:RNAse (barnase) inhibitor barstar
VRDDVNNLAQKLSDAGQSGVYLLTRDPAEVERAAAEAGLAVFRVDISDAAGKKEFLKSVAEALKFPPHFGYNWDALNDFLSDLEWLPIERGFVMIFDGVGHYAARHKQDIDSAIQVLISAADYWKDQGRPFWAFIHAAQKTGYSLVAWP